MQGALSSPTLYKNIRLLTFILSYTFFYFVLHEVEINFNQATSNPIRLAVRGRASVT